MLKDAKQLSESSFFLAVLARSFLLLFDKLYQQLQIEHPPPGIVLLRWLLSDTCSRSFGLLVRLSISAYWEKVNCKWDWSIQSHVFGILPKFETAFSFLSRPLDIPNQNSPPCPSLKKSILILTLGLIFPSSCIFQPKPARELLFSLVLSLHWRTQFLRQVLFSSPRVSVERKD